PYRPPRGDDQAYFWQRQYPDRYNSYQSSSQHAYRSSTWCNLLAYRTYQALLTYHDQHGHLLLYLHLQVALQLLVLPLLSVWLQYLQIWADRRLEPALLRYRWLNRQNGTMIVMVNAR